MSQSGPPTARRVVLFNALRGSFCICESADLPMVDQFLAEGAFKPTSFAEQDFLDRTMELGYAVDDQCDEIEIGRNRKQAGMQDCPGVGSEHEWDFQDLNSFIWKSILRPVAGHPTLAF